MAQLRTEPTRTVNVLPLLLITILGAACLISLFGNISHPLLWNDEAETAEFGQRILRFGYPRVWDGKNVLNLFEGPDRTVSVSQPLDAYIGSTWGQYYVAAVGAYLATYTDDLYSKTTLIRIPFATAGILGIAVFAEAVSAGLSGQRRLWFLVLFSAMILLSVPLVLHLREARYYSLVALLSGCIFSVYLRFRFYHLLGFVPYTILLVLLLLAMLNTFSPAFAIFVAFLSAYETYLCAVAAWHTRVGRTWARDPLKNAWREFAKGILPLVLSSGMALPFLFFYKIPQLADASTMLYGFNLQRYVANLLSAVFYLVRRDYLLIAVLVNALQIDRLQRFFGLFVFIYLLFIARVPILYSRYSIVITPILIAIVALGIVGLSTRKAVVVLLAASLIYCLPNLDAFQGHLRELATPYQGPLDFAIPYIQSTTPDPSKLVIATNYEEPAYMYYLNSRVTVGYVKNNPEGNLQIVPDIIVSRKNRPNGEILKQLSGNGTYSEVHFPVFDSLWNNIPELNAHLFATRLAGNDNEALQILVR